MCPTVIVLLRAPLSAAEFAALDALLRELAAEVVTIRPSTRGQMTGFDGLGGWHLANIPSATLLGAPPEELAAWRPENGVFISVSTMREHDEAVEAPQYREEIGYYPQQCLVCDGTGKQPIHHRILGNVALRLAEYLESYIDLAMAVSPAHAPGPLPAPPPAAPRAVWHCASDPTAQLATRCPRPRLRDLHGAGAATT